jgi:flavin-dependent dehydrogenase
MATWDVVIVGARVAGASTGMLLARAGLRVLLVERSRRGSDTLSTHALMRAGVLQLSRWGLLDRVVAGATPIRRTLFHYYGEEPVAVSIRPSPGVPALYAPRRTVLDRVLVEAAEEAGAVVLHGHAVTDVLRDTTGRVTGIRTRDRHGTTRTEHATIVVGADGHRSLVAERVGAEVHWQGHTATHPLYAYVADLPCEGYEWYYSHRVAGGLIPTHDGLTCVFVGPTRSVLDELLARGPAAQAFDEVARTVPGLSERLATAGTRSPVRVARGVPGFLRQAHGPGWALVGDAGYWKDPLSTHGMTDAMRDAELLARAIATGLDARGADLSGALADYQQTRERLSRPMFEVVEQMASMTWDRTGIQRLLRTLASTMVEEVETLESLQPWPDLPARRPTSSVATAVRMPVG